MCRFDTERVHLILGRPRSYDAAGEGALCRPTEALLWQEPAASSGGARYKYKITSYAAQTRLTPDGQHGCSDKQVVNFVDIRQV